MEHDEHGAPVDDQVWDGSRMVLAFVAILVLLVIVMVLVRADRGEGDGHEGSTGAATVILG